MWLRTPAPSPVRSFGEILAHVADANYLFCSAAAGKPDPIHKDLKLPVEAVLIAAGLVVFTAWLVAASVALQHEPVRAGANGLMLGVGAGVCAVLGGSALIGQYGMALGAGSGAFLLLVMVLGGRVEAGATLTLTVSVLAALIAAGAVLLAKLHWTALIALALVPVLVRLPLPRGAAWMQAAVASVYALVAAGGALAVSWLAARGWRL